MQDDYAPDLKPLAQQTVLLKDLITAVRAEDIRLLSRRHAIQVWAHLQAMPRSACISIPVYINPLLLHSGRRTSI